MKEIGGYFGLEDLPHNEYYPDLVAVNSARNALLYILRALSARKLYIPCYLCDSVSRALEREGFPYGYYAVGKDFMPEFDLPLDDGEYLYVVNYFGQISDTQAAALKEKHKNVILDNVQAFFQRPANGLDTVYSCRKFFGVSDGGYAATTARLQEPLPADVSMERMKHVLGRYEGTASGYYPDFVRNEEAFYSMNLRQMSRLTRNILGAVDYESIREKREANFRTLHGRLKDRNPLRLTVPVGPYAYPFYCPGGMTLKKALAHRKIYVATLWPDAIPFGGLAKEYSENILPLPCDQRYGESDMEHIVEELEKCMSI